MARQIELITPKTIVIISEVSIVANNISIDSVIDDGEKVIACVSFMDGTGNTKVLTLWEGGEYASIGQWTDNDVNKRLLEVI